MKPQDLEQLAGEHHTSCISIYMPTHRAGEAVLKGEDRLLLKKLLKGVRNVLESNSYESSTIDTLLAPIQELINAKQDWTFRSDGLALFASDGFFKLYSLPVAFTPYTCVSSTFYLVPLMPLFVDEGDFLLLTLELNEIKLYKASRFDITEIILGEHIPSRLEEEVGYDHEQKNLQFRNQKQGHGETIFHGQGEGKEDRKEEISKFFKAIDRGLSNLFRNENVPLLIAGSDDQYPIYRKINTYPKLMDGHLPCHPSDLTKEELRARAWKIMGPEFSKAKKEKLNMFERNRSTHLTSYHLDEIVPKALQGRVDTLFLRKGVDLWGSYDPENKHLHFSKAQRSPAVPLDNLIAVSTFLQGGKVYVMEKEDMPISNAAHCVLYKY